MEEYKPNINDKKSGYKSTVRFLPIEYLERVISYTDYLVDKVDSYYISPEEARRREIRKKREIRIQKLNSLNENKS